MTPAASTWRWTPLRVFFFAALVVACALTRFIDLGLKPIMHDESLFVYYTEFQLHRDYIYGYMPILHGPLHLWLQAAVFHVFGTSEYTFRLSIAILGFAAFFWVWSLRDWLGERGTWAALTAYVVSPQIMYYNRFFREDGVYLFLTFWIIASLLWWWRTRRPWWLVSLVLALTLLFCNKESSLFIYFTLVTFGLLVVVHDLARGILDDDATPPPIRVVEATPRVPWLAVAAVGFGCVTVFLTQVMEGIRYDADVVQQLSKDFALRDVRSIALALGYTLGNEAEGGLHRPFVWRAFYVGLAVASVLGALLLKVFVEGRWGHKGLLAQIWERGHAARWHLLGAVAASFAIYILIFTTVFKYSKGPFQIYHETLAYWMGQHAIHRISGPFHMHMVNALVYELPAVLLVAGAWVAIAWRSRWRPSTATTLALAALAMFAFHAIFFRGLASRPMPFFLELAVWGGLLAFAAWLQPRLAPWLYGGAIIALAVDSVVHFSSPDWAAFLAEPVMRGKEKLAPTGLEFLDDTISSSSGAHLFLIALLTLVASVQTWLALDRGRRFEALMIWWTITMTGAAAYAREKMPQVGIHVSVPLVFLVGIYVERYWHHVRSRAWRGAALAVLVLAAVWQLKAALHVNFVFPGDVRERLVYGDTPFDLKHHAEMVVRYQQIAGVRDKPYGPTPYAEWVANYNDKVRLKKVKAVLAEPSVIWPLRWYLRDVEWNESTDIEGAIRDEVPFLFLRLGDENTPGLQEKYVVHRGRARMHWIPNLLDFEALGDIWKVTIPRHNRINSPRDVEAQRAWTEWGKVWAYLWNRDIPLDGDPRLSYVEYHFAVRRDLGPI